MKNIKNIRLSKKSFIIDLEESSLKLSYKDEPERYVIDISKMNLIYALKTAIFASTFCFIRNFPKKLCWLVKDEETKRAISILRLKNVEQEIKKQTKEKAVLVS